MPTAQEVLNQACVQAEVLKSITLHDKQILHILQINETDAMEIVQRLLAVAENTGYCPLIVYGGDVDYHLDCLEDNHKMPIPGQLPGQSATDVSLAAAAAFDFDQWIKGAGQNADDFGITDGDFSKDKDEWSAVPTSNKLFLVPVKYSWQIPAVLYFGGWNDCPEHEVHMALLKRWHQKYGADLVCMGPDSLYCTVARPVTTRDEAMSLAREQAYYCPDNVVQGYGDNTISGLAIDLQNSKAWQFWWD